jgi:starch phosphorylase
MPKAHCFKVLPAVPAQLDELRVIASNMYWCWNKDAEALFRRVDNKLWLACGNNPIKLLGTVGQERLETLGDDSSFLNELARVADKFRAYIDGRGWFDGVCSNSAKPIIAYFSAEFGVHECLPSYAGGLGVLAGDHLKSASDLGVPMVGMGLLYQKGYFRQYLNADGWQQELYAESDFHNMPIELVRGKDDQPLTVSVEYPGRSVAAQIWCVSVGRIKLYFLDTNVPTNASSDRMITASLYGGNVEVRIRQEIMLGIGGFRALKALGIDPIVCHMNEGHAGFAALERIRQLRESAEISFEEALEAVRAGNLFTMHTPVKAGIDEFSVGLMDKYFGGYFACLGLNREQFLGLGRIDPEDKSEPFKMPILALKLSGYRNAVSRLHGQVSRNMWAFLWPGVPVNEVPISSIANGVHFSSWVSGEMADLYERYLGPQLSDHCAEKCPWKNVHQIPDEELWRAHQRCKERLVVFARNRLKSQIKRRGTYHTELNWAEEVLDPEALTIGFARRFATYKRGNLLLKDPARLAKLLTDAQRPVQMIFAGKAHPRDTEAKEIIRQIIHFASQYEVRRRVVFLEDYDINIARHLVRGVDVWLNTPRRPMEASGTSGMKAAINGALNLSTLDGWWCEGFRPEGGWAIGAGEAYEDVGYQDVVEAQALYSILENEVIPLFYTRSADNLPRAWIRRVKNSIAWIAPRFNANRMVKAYTLRFYKRAIARSQYLMSDSLSQARTLAAWKAGMKGAWPGVSVRQVWLQGGNGRLTEDEAGLGAVEAGTRLSVRALVRLGGIRPEDARVELYHGPVDAWGNVKEGSARAMRYENSPGGDGEHWFSGTLTCKRTGQHGVAVRVMPRHADLADPYETGLIHWESTGH